MEKCSLCMRKLHDGDVVIRLWGSRKLHRPCLKAVVDESLLQTPPTGSELTAASLGTALATDSQLFEAYRAKLAESMEGGACA